MSRGGAGVARRPRASAPVAPGAAADLLFVLLLPFVQLGFSYWLSVATLAAIVIVIRARRSIVAGLSAEPGWLLAVPLMFLPLLVEGGTDPGQDFLRVAREALAFVLMLGIVKGAARQPIRFGSRRVLAALVMLVSGLLLLTAAQYLFLRSGRYLGFPVDLYAQGQNTIATDLALRYSYVRPSATFSEPSYLGFVLLSVMVLAIAGRHGRMGNPLLVALSVACGLLCQSAGFVMFALLIGGIAAARRASPLARAAMVPAALFALVLVLTIGSEIGIVSRVLNGVSATGDASIFVRIFGPLQVVPHFLVNHPLGLPFSLLERTMLPYTGPLGIAPDQYLMNGLLNFLFEFGLAAGLAMLCAFLSVRDGIIRAYLLSCMVFNGAFLSIDKLAVIGFTVFGYFAVSRVQASPRPRRPQQLRSRGSNLASAAAS